MTEPAQGLETSHTTSSSPPPPQSRPDSRDTPQGTSTHDGVQQNGTSILASNTNDEREATELHEISSTPHHDLSSPSTASFSSEEYGTGSRRPRSRPSSVRSSVKSEHSMFPELRKFWSHHVSLVVSHKKNRDYFGMSQNSYLLFSLIVQPPSVFVLDDKRLQITDKLLKLSNAPTSPTCAHPSRSQSKESWSLNSFGSNRLPVYQLHPSTSTQ